MTITSQAGVFSYGLQAAKGTLATTWYRHRAMDINFGPVQDLRTFMLEVGGIVTPTGAYKAGAFIGGGATLQPRMQGDFGWLVKFLMGKVTTTPGTASAAAVHADFSVAAGTISTGFTAPPTPRRVTFTVTSTVSGGPAALAITGTYEGAAQTENLNIADGANGTVTVTVKEYSAITSIVITGTATGQISAGYYQTNSHAFTLDDDPTLIPWISGRKVIPGPTKLSEVGLDCKLAAARFIFPQNGIVQSRVDMIGREPTWDDNTAVASYAYYGAYEDYKSVPATCVVSGHVKLPNYDSNPQKVTSAQVTMVNNLSTPQAEMIIGSPYPDDFAILSRSMNVQAVLKWEDPVLYNKIFTGNLTSTWNPEPFTSDFEILVKAPKLIPGSSDTNWSLKINAGEVMWQTPGTPTLEGGGMLMLPIQGQVIQPESGQYAVITLVNEQVGYA